MNGVTFLACAITAVFFGLIGYGLGHDHGRDHEREVQARREVFRAAGRRHSERAAVHPVMGGVLVVAVFLAAGYTVGGW